MNGILLASLDPPERLRLEEILHRPPETQDERDRRVREVIRRVEADLRALRDILGIYDDDDEGRSDEHPPDR